MRHLPIIYMLFLQIIIANTVMSTRSKSGIKLEQFENRINVERQKIDETKRNILAEMKKDENLVELLEKIQSRLVVIGDAIQMPHLSFFAEINVENIKELKDFLIAITADSASASSSSTTTNAFPLIPPTKMMAHFKGKFDNFLKDLQLQKAAEDKAETLAQSALRSNVKLKIYKDWKQMKVQKPQTDTLKAKAELWKVLLHKGIVQFAASLDTQFKELINFIVEIKLLDGNNLENYWKLHWLEELAKACLELFEFLNSYNIKHNTANEIEVDAIFINMDNAYTAVGKRLDWLLGRTEPKMAWEDVAIGHFMASQLRELLEEMCRPGGSEVLVNTIFPELTGHQYDYNNPIDKQEWRMFLLVGYILDLYYLEENYRYQDATKMDEEVEGLDPEQAKDARERL